MKRVRFRDSGGTVRTGTWDAGRVTVSGHEFDPERIEILPPTVPTNVVLIGASYPDRYGPGEDPPKRPPMTMKPASVVSGHGDTVVLPPGRVVYEAELGVVIGEHCTAVPEERAMDVVEGVTCVNDLTRIDEGSRFRKKAFDGSLPIGPVIATPDEVPADATIELRVNGATRQRAQRSDLLFSIPELVTSVTNLFSLERGDIIATGTPAGRDTLSSGDVVEVEIEGVGTLEHGVRRALTGP